MTTFWLLINYHHHYHRCWDDFGIYVCKKTVKIRCGRRIFAMQELNIATSLRKSFGSKEQQYGIENHCPGKCDDTQFFCTICKIKMDMNGLYHGSLAWPQTNFKYNSIVIRSIHTAYNDSVIVLLFLFSNQKRKRKNSQNIIYHASKQKEQRWRRQRKREREKDIWRMKMHTTLAAMHFTNSVKYSTRTIQ